MVAEDYHEMVKNLESGLVRCAKHSFESRQVFIDGQLAFKHFADEWQKGDRQELNRTPIQIQRDRILYSQGMRKQTEKYHVLYNGQRRIVRSYATHAMKMAQVTRAMCRGLKLNEDFGEAMALGAKVGAVPFVHAAKSVMGVWAYEKVREHDRAWVKDNPIPDVGQDQLTLDFKQKAIPKFVTGLESATAFEKLQRYMPWAAGVTTDSLYNSGSESYWLLCINPFTAEVRQSQYYPETMYGIWRHSRGTLPFLKPFHHKFRLAGTQRYNEIKDEHATFESIVVQYADDITWVIENLNDANDVALLNNRTSVYTVLSNELSPEVKDVIPSKLTKALADNDAGAIYSYFITDFVRHSGALLDAGDSCFELRSDLATGQESARIGLSPVADRLLQEMIEFLREVVFKETRTKNRMEMLKSISKACIDLIYDGDGILTNVIEEQSLLSSWNTKTKKSALKLLDDPIHRVQLSMDVLASWGDQEIYDFVGIQSL